MEQKVPTLLDSHRPCPSHSCFRSSHTGPLPLVKEAMIPGLDPFGFVAFLTVPRQAKNITMELGLLQVVIKLVTGSFKEDNLTNPLIFEYIKTDTLQACKMT